MPVFYDQMRRPVEVQGLPGKIVSLVPSQTELLFDLGLEAEIVGVTRFCIHPDKKVKGKRRIGKTKNLDIESIRALAPDLIIGNKEENERTQIEELTRDFPVWMSDISNLCDAIAMIRSIGAITGKQQAADDIAAEIQLRFAPSPFGKSGKTAIYLIWSDPVMAAGKGTFIDDMLDCCGLINAVTEQRYPVLSPSDIQGLGPDLLLLSSEPFPFRFTHVDAFRRMLPHAEIVLVDGEPFSWYGSRLLRSPDYFKSLRAING